MKRFLIIMILTPLVMAIVVGCGTNSTGYQTNNVEKVPVIVQDGEFIPDSIQIESGDDSNIKAIVVGDGGQYIYCDDDSECTVITIMESDTEEIFDEDNETEG